MDFQTTYTPYCSSWLKLFGVYILKDIARTHAGIYARIITGDPKEVAYIIKSASHLTGLIISAAYHAHNLYAEYSYNQSLEAELTVEVKGESRIVKASPNYFNWYTGYNALFLAAIAGLGKDKFYFTSAIICKLISLKDNNVQYNFTDMKTGMSISPEVMTEYMEISNVNYPNIAGYCQNIENNDFQEIITDSHHMMEAAA